MSLVGNLEDLGFGDILQIISLSRKSGVFLVHEETRKAKILFRSGQVIAAFTNFERQDICARLLASGDVNEQLVSDAVRRFRQRGGKLAIADCLVEAGAPQEAVDREVRAEIERAVIDIFDWKDGEFSFELKEIEEDIQRVRSNPYRLVLEAGINPQFLAMEGTRLSDEARRDSRRPAPIRKAAGPTPAPGETAGTEALPAAGPAPAAAIRTEAPPAAPAPLETPSDPPAPQETGDATAPEKSAPPAPASLPAESTDTGKAPVVLVDDDGRFLEIVREALVARGHRVECFGDGASAYASLEKAIGGREPLCVVSDLIMPRTDGEGILGGLELLERVRLLHRTLPFVLFSDHPNDEAERKARLLDVDFVLAKPRSGEIAGGESNRGLEGFLAALDPILKSFRKQRQPADRPPASTPSGTAGVGDAPAQAAPTMQADEAVLDLRQALLPDFEETEAAMRSGEAEGEEGAPGLTILRSMLCELSSPIAGGHISLLVLRFAAEVMNRAVIFMVGKDEVVGLGQFGIIRQAAKLDRRVRSIRIPLGEPSVLHDVVEKRSVLRGPLERNEWNSRLIERLGGEWPQEAFAGPIVAGESVVAVLYSDNLPEQAPLGNTESLEIFLTQAGVAFEKAILERRIRELNVRP